MRLARYLGSGLLIVLSATAIGHGSPMTIYGVDDAKEPYDCGISNALQLAKAVCLVVQEPSGAMTKTVGRNSDDRVKLYLYGDLEFRILDEAYTKYGFQDATYVDPSIKYLTQPSVDGTFGTAFLISPSTVLTTLHSVMYDSNGDGKLDAERAPGELAFVFGFYRRTSSDNFPIEHESSTLRDYTVLRDDGIVRYGSEYVTKGVFTYGGCSDWIIIRLDAPVTGVTPLSIYREQDWPFPYEQPTQNLFMLGYPRGIPLKVTVNGLVASEDIKSNALCARTNLDGWNGNSGSPVLTSNFGDNLAVALFVRGQSIEYEKKTDGTGTPYVSEIAYPDRNFLTQSSDGEHIIYTNTFGLQVPEVCGNNTCESNETCFGCAADCSEICPSCNDGIQNQGEEDVDCGGPCTNLCLNHCSNGLKDEDEVGVDCGGSCPDNCCSNGFKDFGEEGVDCGGTCPSQCTQPPAPGESCDETMSCEQVCSTCPGQCSGCKDESDVSTETAVWTVGSGNQGEVLITSLLGGVTPSGSGQMNLYLNFSASRTFTGTNCASGYDASNFPISNLKLADLWVEIDAYGTKVNLGELYGSSLDCCSGDDIANAGTREITYRFSFSQHIDLASAKIVVSVPKSVGCYTVNLTYRDGYAKIPARRVTPPEPPTPKSASCNVKFLLRGSDSRYFSGSGTYKIDWGDGKVVQRSISSGTEIPHTYCKNRLYTVTVYKRRATQECMRIFKWQVFCKDVYAFDKISQRKVLPNDIGPVLNLLLME